MLMLIFLASCTNSVDKPKNLISKQKMAELVAELTLNEESALVNPTANMEAGARFILKQNNIKASDFTDSYKYYAINQKLEPILEEAQEIIKKKHPEAKAYIEKVAEDGEKLTPMAK